MTEWHNDRLSVWKIERLSPYLSVFLSVNLSVCMSVYRTEIQIDKYENTYRQKESWTDSNINGLDNTLIGHLLHDRSQFITIYLGFQQHIQHDSLLCFTLSIESKTKHGCWVVCSEGCSHTVLLLHLHCYIANYTAYNTAVSGLKICKWFKHEFWWLNDFLHNIV